MAKLPRRLPPSPEERLKILLSKLGTGTAGATRFEGDIGPVPTVSVTPGNTIFVSVDEPPDANVGDIWVPGEDATIVTP